MKFLCEDCSRLVELKEFEVREGALILVCPACKHEGRVPPPAVMDRKPAPVLELAKPKPPPTGPLCPKCGAARPEEAESCAKCGVVFALFKPENLALPGPLEDLWREIETHWTEAERHVAFLSACVSTDVLAEAVRRYRLRAEQLPGDALASRFRDEATARLLATTELPLTSRADPGSKPGNSAAAVILMVLCAIALAAAILWFSHPQFPAP
ncbi:MAG TPA: hypothetical protein VGK67_32580 [Myxococcales bacterium]|jgi:hypothetical protein